MSKMKLNKHDKSYSRHNKMSHKQQGRIDNRNKMIGLRYWWLAEVNNLSNTYVISRLSEEEFFLNERTIVSIILGYSAWLEELRELRPTAKQLRQDFPSFTWDYGCGSNASIYSN